MEKIFKDKEIRQWDIENCDDIKLVMEQNKNLGNRLTNVRERNLFLFFESNFPLYT